MNFVTGQFMVFLALSLSLFFFVPANYRKIIVLASSYLFYATWSLPLISVILFSTSVDYYLGNKLFLSTSKQHRKLLLTASILINCAILVYFKYVNFFLDTGWSLADKLGFNLPLPHALSIILPLGVSFYTFEAISYICDIYRGEKPATSWFNYNFYIMFFPHLISGPIVRYSQLRHQYEEKLDLPAYSKINEGLRLVLYGFMFKLLIADNAASLVDPVFSNYQQATCIEAWLASIGFTVQIYFDFLGYTHIARGVSLFFNIRLPINFNHPYHAKNISDFWQRWHISLSSWIRDYLYIPLGGSRFGRWKTFNNLIVTMFIAGLWHGASWNYALWGVYHGALLALYHLKKTLFPSAEKTVRSDWLAKSVTFLCVVVGWVIFRSASFQEAWIIVSKMFDFVGLWVEIKKNHLADPIILLVMLLSLCFIGPTLKRLEEQFFASIQSTWFKKFTYICASFVVFIFMFSPAKPFIYFVF